ncbi:MAG TPA: O-antigen ligase family protein [Candidatus Omnitrophota bacterium]|nr:O-antigen ligase family protein [Candidatus Omnitrophota bacterium]
MANKKHTAKNLVTDICWILAGSFIILTPYLPKNAPKLFFWLMVPFYCVLIGITYRKNTGKHIIPPTLINPYLIPFGIACLTSTVFCFTPYRSQAIFFDRYLIFLGFFWFGCFLSQSKPQALRMISFFILIASSIFAAGGLWDYIYVFSKYSVMIDRLWSVFGKRIDFYAFPLYLTFFIPFSFSILITSERKSLRIVSGIIFCALFACLLMNGSRIALSAVIAGILLVSILTLKKHRIIISIFLALCITLTMAIGIHSQTLNDRLKSMLIPTEWSNRLPLYKAAIKMYAHKPIFGFGMGSFEKLLHTPDFKLPDNYPVKSELNLHAHNTYLELAVEMGSVGVFSFLIIFIAFFVIAIRYFIHAPPTRSPDEKAMFLGLTATVLSMLIFAFGSTIITVGLSVSAYFWLLFGTACGSLIQRKKEEELPGHV